MKLISIAMTLLFTIQVRAETFTCEFTAKRINPTDRPIEMLIEIESGAVKRITARLQDTFDRRVVDVDYFGPPHVNGVTTETFDYNVGNLPAADCFFENQATVTGGALTDLDFSGTCRRLPSPWQLDILVFGIRYDGSSGFGMTKVTAKDGTFPAVWQDKLTIKNCQLKP